MMDLQTKSISLQTLRHLAQQLRARVASNPLNSTVTALEAVIQELIQWEPERAQIAQERERAAVLKHANDVLEAHVEKLRAEIDAAVKMLENTRQFLSDHEHARLDKAITDLKLWRTETTPDDSVDRTMLSPAGQVIDGSKMWQPQGGRTSR